MKKLFCGAVLMLGVVVAGCGGSDSAPAAKAKPKGDPRPRVEGEWRVLYMPQDSTQTDDRATWQATPDCRYGACGFRVKSDKGIKVHMRFDQALGDYTDRTREKTPCVNEETEETIVEDAYVLTDQVTLTPSMGVKNARGAFATEMTGVRVQRTDLRSEHADSGCDDEGDGQRIDMRLVRIDPPSGRTFYGADPSAPQPRGAS